MNKLSLFFILALFSLSNVNTIKINIQQAVGTGSDGASINLNYQDMQKDHSNSERLIKLKEEFTNICYNTQNATNNMSTDGTTFVPVIPEDPIICEERECKKTMFHELNICQENNFCLNTENH